MSQANILLVEDDAQTQNLIRQILETEGYKVRVAPSIFRAQGEVKRLVPDLVILDRRLPDGDGIAFCRQIKAAAETSGLPILFLTAKGSISDRVLGLKLGGDDYLVKPFQCDELLARVEALFRRVKSGEEPAAKILEVHGIVLDLDRHQCRIGKRGVRLWPKEFELLQSFMERPGRLLSKEFLSERVWGHEFFTSSRAIETAVQRLRRKLGAKGQLLETVKGYGFRLQEEAP